MASATAGCDASAGLAVADWLNGVVEARRKVLVPFERGLLQTQRWTQGACDAALEAPQLPGKRPRVAGSRIVFRDATPDPTPDGGTAATTGLKAHTKHAKRSSHGRGTHHSPLPGPRAESLRPVPLGSRFWPAAAEAKLDGR